MYITTDKKDRNIVFNNTILHAEPILHILQDSFSQKPEVNHNRLLKYFVTLRYLVRNLTDLNVIVPNTGFALKYLYY